jgi:hypothetical protein
MSPRERGDTGRAFAFERLCVETPFARDDEIARRDALFEPERLSDDVETGAHFRAAEAHEAEADSTGGSGARVFRGSRSRDRL